MQKSSNFMYCFNRQRNNFGLDDDDISKFGNKKMEMILKSGILFNIVMTLRKLRDLAKYAINHLLRKQL